MDKSHYEDFNAFESHFNRLMSMKGKEQLTSENEALKDSIAVILAQKKNVHKHCDEKDQQISQLKAENKRLKEKCDRLEKDGKIRLIEFEQHNKLKNQQLAEKDAEIERLKENRDDWRKFANEEDEQIYHLKRQLKTNTHQVCEKIRQYDVNTNKQKTSYTDYVIGLIELLGQLENNTEGKNE